MSTGPRLDLGDQLLRIGLIPEVEQADRSTLGRERTRDRRTDAAAAPGDQGSPAFEPAVWHLVSPRLSSAAHGQRVALPRFVKPSYRQSIDKRIGMRGKATAKLSSRFQISISKAVRTARHWEAGQEFASIPKGEGVLLVPVPSRQDLGDLARGAIARDYRDRTDRP